MWNEETLIDCCTCLCSNDFEWMSLKDFSHQLHGMRKAAVLVPLTVKNGEIFLWLTVRAAHLKNDPGISKFYLFLT